MIRRRPLYKRKKLARRGRGRRLGRGRRQMKRASYHGVKFFKETAKGVDIEMPGTPAGQDARNLRLKLSASLEDISDVNVVGTGTSTKSALKSLFGRYCITGVKYTFIPKFTVSTTQGLAADRVVYAVNRDPNDPVGDEATILRQDDAKFTNTSRKFTIYVKHPKPILYTTAGVDPNRNVSQMPVPAGGGAGVANQVSATLGNNKWVWLPTRYGYNPETGETTQAPAHVGADVHISTMNPRQEAAYSVYTMFKTVYYAFKEQD